MKGRRWGADRICPNGPDEGTSKTAKLDCESEEEQIRFFSPVGRIQARAVSPKRRANQRFAVCADSSERSESESKSLICERGWFFSFVFTPYQFPNELNVRHYLHFTVFFTKSDTFRTSTIKKKKP